MRRCCWTYSTPASSACYWPPVRSASPTTTPPPSGKECAVTTYLSETDKSLPMPQPEVFPRPVQERAHLKRRLTAAVRLFGHYGFDEGISGQPVGAEQARALVTPV